MAVLPSFKGIEGFVLDGVIRVGPAIDSVVPGWFRGEPLPGSDLPEQIYLRLLPERTPGDPLLERHLEAMYLQHPNLLRCHGAGTGEYASTRFVYVAFEPFDQSLPELIAADEIEERDLRIMGLDLAAALHYLHQRNLVCCGLDVPAIVRAGSRWKIGDYSQMRVPGSTDPQETRRLLAASPAVPPEAFEGRVTPAWDSWSLASVLVAAASGPKPDRTAIGPNGRRANPKRELPEPVAAVVTDCLVSEPGQRCGVDRIADALSVPVEADESDPSRPEPEHAAPPDTEEESFRPLETHFHLPEKPKRSWLTVVIAGILAIVAGAVVAAISLNYHRGAGPAASPAIGTREARPSTPEQSGKGSGTAERSGTATEVQGIRDVLDRWVEAGRARDADAQAAFYAPKVDVFYGARNVSRDWVRRNREQALRRISNVRRLEIQNVEIRLDSPEHATVSLEKDWDFGRRSAGRVKQELTMRKVDGAWFIAGERDVRKPGVRPDRRRRSG